VAFGRGCLRRGYATGEQVIERVTRHPVVLGHTGAVRQCDDVARSQGWLLGGTDRAMESVADKARTRRASVALVASVTLFGLTACGGSDEPKAEEKTTSAAPSETTTDAPAASGNQPDWAKPATEVGEKISTIKAGDITVDVYQVGTTKVVPPGREISQVVDPPHRRGPSSLVRMSAEDSGRRQGGAHVSPGRRRPGEQVYRLSDDAIRIWTRVLCISIPVLVITGFIVMFVGNHIADSNPGMDVEESPLWILGGCIMISGAVGPLLIGAALGGEALHKNGWIVGLLLAGGVIATSTGAVRDVGWLRWGGLVAMLVGGIGFFVLGFIRRVPMWIGGVFGTPRTGVSDGRLPGESEPGRLGDDQ
jgi:hypothetical protein